jgi:type II secretion system protein N
MHLLVSLIKGIFRLFFQNLGKIILVILLTAGFIIFLFPLNEISDLASQNVSKFTNNQYYLEFETLKINLLSDLGLEMGNVYLETPKTSPLTFKELVALPSLSALLYSKPQGKIKLKGLFKGDVEIEVSKHKEDSSNEKKIERNLISVEASRLDLKELKNFLVLPVNLKGRLDLTSKIIANLEMQETPEIQDLQINIKNFEMPQTTIEQPGAIPIDIPGIKLTELIIKARFADNKLFINEIKIGKDSDEVLGSIKGNLNFSPLGQGSAFPMLNQYEMNIDLKMKKSFYDKIYLTLSLLNAGSYFTTISGGYQFKSRLIGSGPYSVPRFDAYK